MTADKIGRIVWHDLFSSDRQRSMAFYRRVAGWTYVTEHATDFAWGGGEKDFVLALLDGEAGAGFAETPNALPDGWTAYVEVADVDASITTAERLGGTIIRRPFEVPGVGRNALIRDPLGALIGLSLSRHDFPAPRHTCSGRRATRSIRRPSPNAANTTGIISASSSRPKTRST